MTEDIPEKFRDESGALRADALLRSYRELEKKLSQTPSAPQSPDEYCIDCAHGLFEPDTDVNTKMHGMGLTQHQAQGVYDLAAERLVPLIVSMQAEFRADREIEKLIAHFGGVEPWKQVARQLQAFAERNLPGDVVENLAASYEGVLALHRMMQSQEPGLKRGAAKPGGVDEKALHAQMRDPKYWRDRDPAFVSKVTDGFQQLYGG